MYRIKGFRPGSGKYLVDTICDDAAVMRIIDSNNTMKSLFSEIDYYLILMDNRDELLNDIAINGPGNKKNFIRVNRLILNYLNSYYTWKAFIKHHCMADAQKLIKLWNKYSENRIMLAADALRNYAVHDSVLTDRMIFDCLSETLKIEIDTNKLLKSKYSKLSNGQREAIQSFGDSIELKTFFSSLSDTTKEIQNSIWKIESDIFLNAINNILEYTSAQLPSCFNCWIEDDRGNIIVDIGRSFELFMEKDQLLKNVK